MILLIDNYDSFSYNLFQLVGSLEPEIRVVRNDEITIEEIRKLSPAAILLSPGPGKQVGKQIIQIGIVPAEMITLIMLSSIPRKA